MATSKIKCSINSYTGNISKTVDSSYFDVNVSFPDGIGIYVHNDRIENHSSGQNQQIKILGENAHGTNGYQLRCYVPPEYLPYISNPVVFVYSIIRFVGGVISKLLSEAMTASGGRHDECDQKTEVPRYRSTFTDCRLQQRRIEHPVLRVLWNFELSYIIRDILSIENTNWIRSAGRYISRWISRMDSFYQCQWNMVKTGICDINGLEVA